MGNHFNLDKYSNIVLGFQRNDEMILKHFYQKVYPQVKRYVITNKGDEEQAKDIFQDAFIACWKNIKDNKIDHQENIEAYLFAISKNKWIDYLRSANFKKTISIDRLSTPDPEYNIEANDDEMDGNINMMVKAVRKLNESCRKILNLYYFERLSMKQISARLDIDPASARNKKYRCMEQLRSFTLKSQKNEQAF